MLSILNHLDIKCLNKYDNQDLIKKFYDVVTQKEIVYDITYCGNRKNIKGKLTKYIQLLDKTELKKIKDMTILLDGKSIGKYKDLKFDI